MKTLRRIGLAALVLLALYLMLTGLANADQLNDGSTPYIGHFSQTLLADPDRTEHGTFGPDALYGLSSEAGAWIHVGRGVAWIDTLGGVTGPTIGRTPTLEHGAEYTLHGAGFGTRTGVVSDLIGWDTQHVAGTSLSVAPGWKTSYGSSSADTEIVVGSGLTGTRYLRAHMGQNFNGTWQAIKGFDAGQPADVWYVNTGFRLSVNEHVWVGSTPGYVQHKWWRFSSCDCYDPDPTQGMYYRDRISSGAWLFDPKMTVNTYDGLAWPARCDAYIGGGDYVTGAVFQANHSCMPEWLKDTTVYGAGGRNLQLPEAEWVRLELEVHESSADDVGDGRIRMTVYVEGQEPIRYMDWHGIKTRTAEPDPDGTGDAPWQWLHLQDYADDDGGNDFNFEAIFDYDDIYVQAGTVARVVLADAPTLAEATWVIPQSVTYWGPYQIDVRANTQEALPAACPSSDVYGFLIVVLEDGTETRSIEVQL